MQTLTPSIWDHLHEKGFLRRVGRDARFPDRAVSASPDVELPRGHVSSRPQPPHTRPSHLFLLCCNHMPRRFLAANELTPSTKHYISNT